LGSFLLVGYKKHYDPSRSSAGRIALERMEPFETFVFFGSYSLPLYFTVSESFEVLLADRQIPYFSCRIFLSLTHNHDMVFWGVEGLLDAWKRSFSDRVECGKE
jgi:hypothetical protein